MIPTAPAIAAATGVRIRDLPLSRERVFTALQERQTAINE